MQEIIQAISNFVPWELIIGLLFGLTSVHFITKLKIILKGSSKITKQLGEAFLSTSDVLAKVNAAIKNDGSIKENSIIEIIDAGKNACLEWEDVILEIRPKKIKRITNEEPKMPPIK